MAAIPSGRSNDDLDRECNRYGLVFRGSEHDVLSRYYKAAKWAGADIIVRITGDCPLISPELCGRIIWQREQEQADYASNIDPRTFPQGLDCEVFTMEMLTMAQEHAGSGEREHVTTWIRRIKHLKRVNVQCPWPIDGRMTLDTMDDYKVIVASFANRERLAA